MKTRQHMRVTLISLGILLQSTSTANAADNTVGVHTTLQAGFGIYEPVVGSEEALAYHNDLYEAGTTEKFITFTRYFPSSWFRGHYSQIGLRFQTGQWRVQSTSEESLRVIPLSLGASYRNDFLPKRLGIPLVPYGGGGVASYLWSGSGAFRLIDASASGDHSAIDAVSGTYVNLGLNLDLGVFSRRSFKRSRVKATSLFIEWHQTWLNNFEFDSQDARLNLSDSQWRMGLTVDL